MVDTKTPGDKTLSVPTKTLTLKPRVETGTCLLYTSDAADE